jgi:FdhD protein
VSALARDVSRHNAVDKVIGWSLLNELPRTNLLLCVSGRISADIAFKAWRAGLTIVVSRSLPTRQAVALAEAQGLTLVGGEGEAARTVFSHPWRLVDDEATEIVEPAEPKKNARERIVRAL